MLRPLKAFASAATFGLWVDRSDFVFWRLSGEAGKTGKTKRLDGYLDDSVGTNAQD